MKTMKKTGKKIKKILMIFFAVIFFVILFFFITVFCINLYVTGYAASEIKTEEKDLPNKVDAIIVLGAGLTSDNKPGNILKDRLDTAIKLYNAEVSDTILMSGDHGDYHNEVQSMKEYAMEQGVPEGNIILDHEGYTTYDTIRRAKDVFKLNSSVVVTQKYHLYRAMFFAKKLGLDAKGYPSGIKIQGKYLPLEFRELFARVKAFFYFLF